jgi:hypothetical protein
MTKEHWTGWIYCNECDQTSPCVRTINLLYKGGNREPTDTDISDYAKKWITDHPDCHSCMVFTKSVPAIITARWQYIRFDRILSMFKNVNRLYDFTGVDVEQQKDSKKIPRNRFADIEVV